MTTLKLGNKIIGSGCKPYVIAEIGVNHGGSFDLAKKMIDLAKAGGADAAKFQSYKADAIASKNSPSYWDLAKEPTRSQHELFRKYDSFGELEYQALAQHCEKVGIDFLSTPFDDNAVEFLNPLMPFFKVASADLTNTPFLRKIASKGKPVVLSTGAATLSEISEAVDVLEMAGCEQIVLLHCVLNYPTENCNAHLKMIESLKRTFPNYLVGYSDHTLPDNEMLPLLSASLLGAVVIEKHFTYDKKLPGNDHYHAMDHHDLARFIKLNDKIHELLGPVDYKKPIPSEEVSRLNARRSIVVKSALTSGHLLTEYDLTYKRPGTGISPAYWDSIIGRRLSRNVDSDHILNWSDIH